MCVCVVPTSTSYSAYVYTARETPPPPFAKREEVAQKVMYGSGGDPRHGPERTPRIPPPQKNTTIHALSLLQEIGALYIFSEQLVLSPAMNLVPLLLSFPSLSPFSPTSAAFKSAAGGSTQRGNTSRERSLVHLPGIGKSFYYIE